MVEMPRTAPGPERHQLGFAAAVSRDFSFLLDLGFRCVETSVTFARFESKRRIVQVFHGRASYELGVEIGRWYVAAGTRRESFHSLRDFISLQRDPAEIGYVGTTAATAELVNKFVRKLSEWTRQFAVLALINGDELFEEMERRSTIRFHTTQEGWHAERLRSRANEAWRERDFPAVVAAYAAIDEELSTVQLSQYERRRLDYARKAVRK